MILHFFDIKINTGKSLHLDQMTVSCSVQERCFTHNVTSSKNLTFQNYGLIDLWRVFLQFSLNYRILNASYDCYQRYNSLVPMVSSGAISKLKDWCYTFYRKQTHTKICNRTALVLMFFPQRAIGTLQQIER